MHFSSDLIIFSATFASVSFLSLSMLSFSSFASMSTVDFYWNVRCFSVWLFVLYIYNVTLSRSVCEFTRKLIDWTLSCFDSILLSFLSFSFPFLQWLRLTVGVILLTLKKKQQKKWKYFLHISLMFDVVIAFVFNVLFFFYRVLPSLAFEWFSCHFGELTVIRSKHFYFNISFHSFHLLSCDTSIIKKRMKRESLFVWSGECVPYRLQDLQKDFFLLGAAQFQLKLSSTRSFALLLLNTLQTHLNIGYNRATLKTWPSTIKILNW